MTHAEKESRISKVLTKPMTTRSLSDFSHLTMKQIYPTLVRMELAGKVVSKMEGGPAPRQRIYRLA